MKTIAKNWAFIFFVLFFQVFGLSSLEAGEWLVKYKSGLVVNSLPRLGAQSMGTNTAGRLMKVQIPKNSELTSIAGFLRNPDVEYIVPNAPVYAFKNLVTPANKLQQQWSLAKVQADKAWEKLGSRGSKKITVAVIDTGVDSQHVNLKGNSIPGYDFIKEDDKPEDITSQENPGHGTHCAGIIGADGLVDGGIIGISPEVAIMPLRFLNEKGQGDLNLAIKAIDFAIAKKVDVISASWGSGISRAGARPLIEAIERAGRAGILFVAAAANDGRSNDEFEIYPANAGLDNMIIVAASGANDSKPSWSNFGRSNVSLAAPGEGILSTLPGGKWGNLSGTSMAAPLVAGLAALIKVADGNLKPDEIRSLLQSSADKVAIETACDCRISAVDSVKTAKDKKMFVHPYASTISKGQTLQFIAVYGKPPFQYRVADSSVGSIDANGVFTATVEKGETKVTVTDAKGVVASNHRVIVGRPEPKDGGLGTCPIGHPILCILVCVFYPEIPFCSEALQPPFPNKGNQPFPFPFPFSVQPLVLDGEQNFSSDSF